MNIRYPIYEGVYRILTDKKRKSNLKFKTYETDDLVKL